MNRWIMRETGRGTLELDFQHADGRMAPCGESPSGTRAEAVAEWILSHGETCPGDAIVWPDGSTAVLTFKAGAQA